VYHPCTFAQRAGQEAGAQCRPGGRHTYRWKSGPYRSLLGRVAEDRASPQGDVRRVGGERLSCRDTNPLIRRRMASQSAGYDEASNRGVQASGTQRSHTVLCGAARSRQCVVSTGETCFPPHPSRRTVGRESGTHLGRPGSGAAGGVRLGDRSQSDHSSESQGRSEGMREILWHRRETRRKRRRQRALWSHATEL
jgi:hypothetical protein